MIHGKENKDIKTSCSLTIESIHRACQKYLFQAFCLMDFKVRLYRVESCKYLYPAVKLY